MSAREDRNALDCASLRELYGEPSIFGARKVMDRLDVHARRFVSLSPSLCISSAAGDGRADVSPRGDAPGFVYVLDDRTLVIPDRPGNNRIDGLSNLVEDQRIGLIFLVPGANETFRVNGRARISCDPNLKRRFAVEGKEPRTVMVVAVEQAFQHCPKALVRSALWQAARGSRPEGVPTLGDFAAARNPNTDSAAFDAEYTRRSANDLY